MKIYCLEDDESIRELIVYTLRVSGYEAEGFAEPRAFYAALEEEPLPDLVLLDVMLPGEDGNAVLARLRQNVRTRSVPVIMVTAKSTEYDKVKGLDGGADDYITKPFGTMEFLSRVRAVLRRTEPALGGLLTAGLIALDPDRHEVHVAGEAVLLTLKEFELLRELMLHPGLVLTRDQLLDRIWGYDAAAGTRTVDVHMRTLRQKLGEGGTCLATVRGVGYRIEVPR